MSTDLTIRVNVRYVAPPNSRIQDALQLFRSQNWAQFLSRYIMPQLSSASPTSSKVLDDLAERTTAVHQDHDGKKEQCVICMEELLQVGIQLPCGHFYHQTCLTPWLRMHSTCPTCRYQLPTDARYLYSVQSINTTIVLHPSQANTPKSELLNLPAGTEPIQAIVNARVRRRNSPKTVPIAEPAEATATANDLVNVSLELDAGIVQSPINRRESRSASSRRPSLPVPNTTRIHRTRRRSRQSVESVAVVKNSPRQSKRIRRTATQPNL